MYPVLFGVGASIAYFRVSESTVPKDSNCSYLAPISTDIWAIIAGGVLINQGNKNKDELTIFIGSAILGIHTQQMLAHKVKPNQILQEKN